MDLSHGSGGRATEQLVEEMFLRHLDNEWLLRGNDAAVLAAASGRMVVSTDAHVISPLFFPGGDIGSLAVNGTINDVAMVGATPLYLAASFIIEEGYPLRDLDRIVASMAKSSREASVPVIAGDTKVVEKGKGDGVFISTTGIGIVPEGVEIAGNRARPGDAILLSGTIGDHGVAVMSSREHLEFETAVQSDSAPLHTLVARMVGTGSDIRCLRDPTRGGLATTLNELAMQSNVGMIVEEQLIRIAPQVSAACELLGLDPLYVANEGKLVCVCDAADAERLIGVMRQHRQGKEATIIGKVVADSESLVRMQTSFGGHRVIDWLTGEQLPRIC